MISSSLTALAVVGAILTPAVAQLSLSLPAASSVRLGLSGDNAGTAGGVAASAFGHAITAQNAPGGTFAYTYLLGAESAGTSLGYTDTAKASAGTTTGMGSTAAYIAGNALNFSNLTLRFGPTGTASGTWNLGSDVQGVNYYQNAGSPIEERIYTANANAVQAALYYAGTKIMTFGYTPMNMIINYGATTSGNDDTIQAYSAPVSFNVVSGLSGTSAGLAQALAGDFTAGGGLVQLRFDSFQTATRVDAAGTLGATGIFSFSGSIQAIPEPSTYAAWAGVLALVVGVWVRRRARA